MKNPWSARNRFIKDFIPSNISIVDIGCGNKEILDFCRPTKYLGIDINNYADLYMDLNDPKPLNDRYDLGLVLGVLEYLNDPDYSLSKIKYYADKFLKVTCSAKIKVGWKTAFDKEKIQCLLKKHFTKVNCTTIDRYTVTFAEEIV